MSHQLWNPCRTYNLSPNQLYFLDCCRYKIAAGSLINEKAEFMICQSKGLITNEGKLTDKALVILDEFEIYQVKTKKKVATSVLGDNFLDKIKEYREIFPAQKLPHGELARQSMQELKDKFIWFFKTYPEYSWEIVLDATDYYVYAKSREHFNYMATSSYFIKKTDPRTKEISSKLADYCQMITDNPEILKQP